MAKKTKYLDLPAGMSVSRNVLGTASDFDAFEMNIIVTLLMQLRQFMYVSGNNPDPGEFFLRFSSLTDRHVKREELVDRINKLRQKDIRYRITTPGENLQVITGLFSSVVVTTGGVLARVSPEAIPWLLYIGKGVGYVQIEPELFLGMTSVYYKRLYLTLCFRINNGVASFTVDRNTFLKGMGIPKGTPIHDVIARYLVGLQNYLENKGSKYCLAFEPISRSGTKAGHPTITSFAIIFNVRPEILEKEKNRGPNVEPLNLLLKLIPVLKKRVPGILSPSEIHNQLVEKGLDRAFYQVMSAYFNNSTEHQANTLPYVLRDQFQIDIFTHADDNKNK